MAAELADQMLPTITTIEVKAEMLEGDNLIAWRTDLGLDAAAQARRNQDPSAHPPTLVVLNPGDTELPSIVPRRSTAGCAAAAASATARALSAASALAPEPRPTAPPTRAPPRQQQEGIALMALEPYSEHTSSAVGQHDASPVDATESADAAAGGRGEIV